MLLRFEDCTNDVVELSSEIISEFFPELRNVKIKYVFDLKKRKSGGLYTLARCQKTNDILKYFTIDEANDEEGFAYIIYLDKLIWENIEKPDRIRILRHELRHIFVDPESERNPYKMVDHDVSDFREEIALNIDDPNWDQRLVGLLEDLYSQQEDMEED